MPPIEDTAETEAAPAAETGAAPEDNNVALAVKIEGVGEHTPPAEEEEAATPAAEPEATPAATTDDLLREALVSFQAASGSLYHLAQAIAAVVAALEPHVPALSEPVHPAPPSDS